MDSLMVSYFPNNLQTNKYLQMWWGVQQECSEPHAAYIPCMIDLVADVTKRCDPTLAVRGPGSIC